MVEHQYFVIIALDADIRAAIRTYTNVVGTHLYAHTQTHTGFKFHMVMLGSRSLSG